jgi:CheY-like chemotaxis protein
LEANNGNAALRIFEMENHIDLLITDVIMPGLTGPELAAHLRERRPALKVLFISGYADEKLEHQGLINEATLFLQKPFSPNLLAMKVRELLSRAS